MIVLNLQCSEAHPFEGWFDSTNEFDRQAQAEMVTCPICGDTRVVRLPSGPRVLKANGESSADTRREFVAGMMRALTEMASQSEDVAERFPEEARRMHYGETEVRSIRGRATPQETRELLEEGIALLPLPVPAQEDMH